jgi:hypothetical protein
MFIFVKKFNDEFLGFSFFSFSKYVLIFKKIKNKKRKKKNNFFIFFLIFK